MDETQKLAYESKLYTEQLRLIENEVERISNTMGELVASHKAINALQEDAVFVPIGGGAMVNVKIITTEVLVPVGSGYLINLKKDIASEEIKKRISSVEKAIERFKQEYIKIQEKLREVNTELRATKR